MCEECLGLDKQSAMYRRFLDYHLDALTIERLKSGLQALEERKKALHPFGASTCAEPP
jgi:hypothetical protein